MCFETGTIESKALPAAMNPVNETSSPLLLGNVPEFTPDCQLQQLNVAKLPTSQAFLEQWKLEKVTGREVGRIRQMGNASPLQGLKTPLHHVTPVRRGHCPYGEGTCGIGSSTTSPCAHGNVPRLPVGAA